MSLLREAKPVCRPGDRVRVQPRGARGFEGVVLARGRSLVVRSLVRGEGVERTLLLGGGAEAHVEVLARGRVRRAALTYLRSLGGLEVPRAPLPKRSKRRRRKRGAQAKAERRARALAQDPRERRPPPGSAGVLARLRPGDPPFVPPRPRSARG